MNNTNNKCPLCASITGKGAHKKDYPIMSYRDFTLIPALAPVQPGHILLCTKSHVTRMSALPPHSVNDLELFARKIQIYLYDYHKLPSVLFEHGYSNEHTENSCGIIHFHMHVVPLPETVYQELLDIIFADLPFIVKTDKLVDNILNREEYIFGKGYSEDRWRITKPSFSITSRHILKIIDNKLNNGNCLWDEELYQDSFTASFSHKMYDKLR